MPENNRKRGKPNRSLVAGNEGYEVNDLAAKPSITRKQARGLTKRIGNNRQAQQSGRKAISLGCRRRATRIASISERSPVTPPAAGAMKTRPAAPTR